MHVHTIHSGMCTVPLLRRICREWYTDPEELYMALKARGMDLVTVTDHDSIDAAERLRRHPDFFLSEEATCRMPSGTEIHVGVYDISERDHLEIQNRRNDIESLAAFLRERDLFFTVNHIFSGLTGRRDVRDFGFFASQFPGFEAWNGHMPEEANLRSGELARRLGKAVIGGSDAHTLGTAGRAWTEVPGAGTKDEFLAAVRTRRARLGGGCGSNRGLTSEVLRIGASMISDRPWTAPVAVLAPLVPVATAISFVRDAALARIWPRRLENRSRAAALPGVASSEA